MSDGLTISLCIHKSYNELPFEACVFTPRECAVVELVTPAVFQSEPNKTLNLKLTSLIYRAHKKINSYTRISMRNPAPLLLFTHRGTIKCCNDSMLV